MWWECVWLYLGSVVAWNWKQCFVVIAVMLCLQSCMYVHSWAWDCEGMCNVCVYVYVCIQTFAILYHVCHSSCCSVCSEDNTEVIYDLRIYLHLPLCDVKSEVNNCVSFLWLKVCSHHMTFQYLLLSAITISSTDITALTAELVKSVPLFCLWEWWLVIDQCATGVVAESCSCQRS